MPSTLPTAAPTATPAAQLYVGKGTEAVFEPEAPAVTSAPARPKATAPMPVFSGEAFILPENPEEPIGGDVVIGPCTRKEPCKAKTWCTIVVTVDADGALTYSDAAAQTIPLSMRTVKYLSPEYYAQGYGETYQLYGSEAAIVLEIRNDSEHVALIPQTAMRIAFANKADVQNDAYPLMDAPFAGMTDISIDPGETVTVYKRFAWHELTGIPPYLAVSYSAAGEPQRTYFQLKSYNK